MNIFNKLLAGVLPAVPKSIVRKVSARYIAGAFLTDAIRAVRQLNGEGAMATVDVLGEYIKSLDEAEANTRYAIEVLEGIHQEKVNANLSVKLTSIALGLDNGACEQNIRRILDTARNTGNFVRFDMEDSRFTTLTIELYDKLRREYDNLGVVLQAYLRRTETDIKDLMQGGKTNIRLCKGIYIEPEAIAFKDRKEIQDHFLRSLEVAFTGGAYVGIATHDDVLIDGARSLIRQCGRNKDQYEFQMLLGVRDQKRRELLRDGHRLRVYVPFGADWYGYSVRRLKENPAIAGHIIKAFFSGGK
jgi:proline dehydrogenase